MSGSILSAILRISESSAAISKFLYSSIFLMVSSKVRVILSFLDININSARTIDGTIIVPSSVVFSKASKAFLLSLKSSVKYQTRACVSVYIVH